MAACARTPGRAEAFCKEHGGRPHTGVEEMLDRERPDVLCVTTPSGAHLEPTLAAAERGVHVFCEKPMEVTAERMDAMIDGCASAGVSLGGVFQQRKSPLLGEVHAAATAGRFGPRPVLQATVPWWRDDAYYGGSVWRGTRRLDGGGALINQGIHAVDVLLWLAAAGMPDLAAGEHPVARVIALTAVQGRAPAGFEVEDTCVVNLRLRDGRLAQVLATTAARPGGPRRFWIGGSGGTAEVLEERLVAWDFGEPQPGDDALRKRFGTCKDSAPGAGDPLAFSHARHRESLADFLAALDADTPTPLDGHAARQAVDLVLAAYRSAAAGGAPVDL